MRVRKLTLDGDYQLGHGDRDFYQNTAIGVAQNVATRLALWRGAWFINLDEGTPWIDKILGKQKAAELVLKRRILETEHVTGIKEFVSILDVNKRTLTVTATINTDFGETKIKKDLLT